MSKQPSKILITGGAGAGGSYMIEHLKRQNPAAEIYALVRNEASLARGYFNKSLAVEIAFCELRDLNETKKMIEKIKPDQIYHFASNADVLYSFKAPNEVLSNNIDSTVNLFEACRQIDLKTKILLASTSEVYGQVQPHEIPIKETNALRPASPYAVSKTTQDLLSEVYFKSYGLPIVRTRMFTYINPRRPNLFATAFAMQVARIEAGLQFKLTHGNLDSVRTHLDIRDVTKAYELAMNLGAPGEIYNIGGKTPFTVGEFLEILKGKAKTPILSELDEKLLRPVDVTLQIPDVTKFEKLTNWSPQYKLSESIDLLLEECRKKIKSI